MKRLKYRIEWSKLQACWVLLSFNEVLQSWALKRDAVHEGSSYVRALHELDKSPSQLVIKGKDGKIQSERTYGKDPVRYKG